MPNSFGATISGGIQNVSAILPLLGTEQCEKHVESSLNSGFLYAAATPLSIFGSLGAVQAAFGIGLASIPSHWFFGAKILKDAGFDPTGEVASMITLDGKRYLAESRLLSILEDRHIHNPENLSVQLNDRPQSISTSSWKVLRPSWNTSLVITSLLVAGLSLIPYLHFIIRHDTSLPLLAWLFPLIRAIGSILCVVPAQFILQNRILLILKQRILFMQIDKCMKDMNIDVTSLKGTNISRNNLEEGAKTFIDRVGQILRAGRSGTLPPGGDSRAPSPVEEPMATAAEGSTTTAAEDLKRFICSPILLIVWQLMLLFGIVASVVGYVGCFSLVQDIQSTAAGRYLWLGLEAVLSLVRMAIWASNPEFDDSEGIQLNLGLSAKQPSPLPFNADQSTFDAVDERKFREDFTEYCGPMDRLDTDNIFLYYTLIGDHSSKDLHITFFDKARQTAVLRIRTKPDGFCLYNAGLCNRELSGTMQVTRGVEIPSDHRLMAVKEKPFLDKLTAHYDSIMLMLMLDGKHKGNSCLIKVSWLLGSPALPLLGSDEAWSIIRATVDNIMIKLNEGISYSDCMRCHTVAFEYAQSAGWPHLYCKLEEYFSDHVRPIKECVDASGSAAWPLCNQMG
ncbi:hypothetical protein PILCRDRAFT_496126 [Piloderma croceum F 1598]|uniref:Uncharacterized protein n=1 Tax=Piloderma croceum (strain F 1598) TaxID=765440 RepID=A0A0C3FA66_PILCF|nr:hypothetical protein PILCRDRAFT_496126 [Piloderma croceum F 1598]